MTIEHPTPVVVVAGRHRAFWMVVRLIGVLIALLIMPVLIGAEPVALSGDLAGRRAGDHWLVRASQRSGVEARAVALPPGHVREMTPLIVVLSVRPRALGPKRGRQSSPERR
jgi:hypothetical protein